MLPPTCASTLSLTVLFFKLRHQLLNCEKSIIQGVGKCIFNSKSATKEALSCSACERRQWCSRPRVAGGTEPCESTVPRTQEAETTGLILNRCRGRLRVLSEVLEGK